MQKYEFLCQEKTLVKNKVSMFVFYKSIEVQTPVDIMQK